MSFYLPKCFVNTKYLEVATRYRFARHQICWKLKINSSHINKYYEDISFKFLAINFMINLAKMINTEYIPCSRLIYQYIIIMTVLITICSKH